MDVLPFDPFGFVGGMIAIRLLVPRLTTGLILGTIEYTVRMRALRGGDD